MGFTIAAIYELLWISSNSKFSTMLDVRVFPLYTLIKIDLLEAVLVIVVVKSMLYNSLLQ